ncbi:MAG: arylamine N-acetyltransferase, partial [Bacteroidota bacterium]
MNIPSYLKRINLNQPLKADEKTLFQLHQAHLYHVPFEDLNIHFNIPIVLAINDLYQKVVVEKRGGFCYELNGLFIELLNKIGFQTTLISAKVINKHGIIGP